MRAVNLLPKDLRSAGAGGGSGSAAGPLVLIGVLALAVVLVGAWAFSSRQVEDRQAEVTRLNAEAAAAEAQAADLAGFEAIVTAADTRRTAVVNTITGRVAWADVLEEISRTVPAGTTIDSMKATSAAAVNVEGGTTNPLRSAIDAPAVELTGCAPSQSQVAQLISRLRSMKDVDKVSISSSEKSEGSGAAGGADSSGDCTFGSDQRPVFEIVVFLAKKDGAPTTTAAGGTTPAAASTTTTTGSGK